MEQAEQKGFCICVECNIKYPHYKGHPCRNEKCEKCGQPLMREGSYHHQLYLKKIGESNYESGNSNPEQCCR